MKNLEIFALRKNVMKTKQKPLLCMIVSITAVKKKNYKDIEIAATNEELRKFFIESQNENEGIFRYGNFFTMKLFFEDLFCKLWMTSWN